MKSTTERPTFPQRSSETQARINALLTGKLPNWQWRTMGGKQFWTDQLVHHGWRIQRSVLTNHFRLLDENNVRRAWGGYRPCLRKFQELKVSEQIPPMDGKVVILLHGLSRTRESFAGLEEYLEDQSEYQVIRMSYASARGEIGDHAAALHRVIKNLPDARELHLVGHSLGNLVIRHYWADQSRMALDGKPDPRIKRVVMLAPPNNGARMAEMFEELAIFKLVWGVSGSQIAEWSELERRLATPSCEFGIIARGEGDTRGRSPLLEGDDDLVVTVEETKLPGAHDFVVLPTYHTYIMDHVETRECLLRFLRKGWFLSRNERTPLPRTPETGAPPASPPPASAPPASAPPASAPPTGAPPTGAQPTGAGPR